jgi:hypothetical protein
MEQKEETGIGEDRIENRNKSNALQIQRNQSLITCKVSI